MPLETLLATENFLWFFEARLMKYEVAETRKGHKWKHMRNYGKINKKLQINHCKKSSSWSIGIHIISQQLSTFCPVAILTQWKIREWALPRDLQNQCCKQPFSLIWRVQSIMKERSAGYFDSEIANALSGDFGNYDSGTKISVRVLS